MCVRACVGACVCMYAHVGSDEKDIKSYRVLVSGFYYALGSVHILLTLFFCMVHFRPTLG